ncbi:MAG TPA: glutamate synthase-related protein [Candidatus Saccharimonadales bacterium]|nr:glutamate synthase-related protein [Candidatus Saccharimonadales bacterium]
MAAPLTRSPAGRRARVVVGPPTDRRPAAPLYDASFEHDACGVGFVAESRTGASARVIPLALQALAGLTHRGAIAADARTGDGAGLAVPLSPAMWARILADAAIDPTPGTDIAVGMLFLPSAMPHRAAARQLVESALEAEGLASAGWRIVPTDPSVLGPTALERAPAIEQVMVRRPSALSALRFEQRLLLARRAIEFGARDVPELRELHVPSLSSRTIVFKGLFIGAELGRFYLDLVGPAPSVSYAIVHQRYSTNTHPSWRLAQPFRFIAHNGEINTVRGNREAMAGRAARLGGGAFGRRLGIEAGRWPLLDPEGSDSTSLDEALELLVAAGWRADAALLALVPEAPDLRTEPLPELVPWQARMAARTEPWDGPAALVFGDGRRVGAILDRNGLRPAAWELHRDGLVVLASEAGVLDVPPQEIVRRGRLEPGGLLVVDTAGHHLLEDREAKLEAIEHAMGRPGIGARTTTEARATAGRAGVGAEALRVVELATAGSASSVAATAGSASSVAATGDAEGDLRRRILLGLDAEQLRLTVRSMATSGREPIWSMGDDTPLAALARRSRPASAYLRQSFAQVTNPPIDPERERVVMSLELPVGRRPGLLDPPGGTPAGAWLTIASPVLDDAAWRDLVAGRSADGEVPGWSAVSIDATWAATAGPAGLPAALDRIARRATAAARRGATLLVFSDRAAGPTRLPIPSVLAVGAAHVALTHAGLRGRTDIAVEAGDAFDVHVVAMLVAVGSSAVHPWQAIALACETAGSRGHEGLTAAQASRNLLGAIEHGLRKVLARMGISTLASYRGGQLFEVIGLDPALCDTCFPTAPRITGNVDALRLGREIVERQQRAYSLAMRPVLQDPGFARFRGDGELHAFAPSVVKAVQSLATGHATGVGPGAQLESNVEASAVDERLSAYRSAVDRERPAMVRDLLAPRRTARPVPLQSVEAASTIVQRFVSSAMSLGSLSPEAHQALSIGMRRLGGAANTGEGGEDPAWYEPGPNGELHEAAIKQVASARFGVTAAYLARAEQLEIKMAQGSKPGEGGQLPGAKATPLIAALRRGQPGMTMISPPPHHDIYSIEDLAQLIADLRAINPTARIGVKLVATRGVGTIAAGVAKAHADYVMISGHSGGTGASPLASIKQVGLPWELGLAEAHQVLVHQGLRDRVALRVDGGLQTGRDVVIAALLGAEEYGFGTSALVALGCDMARQCHLDTCPTGIATQRPDLRAKFTGTPEAIVEFFTAIAEDVRRELAAAGFRTLEEALGRTDRLEAMADAPIALDALLAAPAWILPSGRRGRTPRLAGRTASPPASSAVDGRLSDAVLGALADGRRAVVAAACTNSERTVGARLSGELARHPEIAAAVAGPGGGDGAPVAELVLSGAAGQSLGAFLAHGVRIQFTGVANDFVGKGLSGGEIVVRPSSDGIADPAGQAIAGNACLYGATEGRLHLVGRAGIRFAVRNSGATAVVEGLGPHGCEYMTGGTVVVLGSVGRNFGAGMTGGRALLYDPVGSAPSRVQSTSVTARPLTTLDDERKRRSIEADLRALVEAHARAGSARAAALVADWAVAREAFWLVEPLSQ